jgi:hypothetical protein
VNGVLSLEAGSDSDYILDGACSVWIMVGNISVYIRRVNDWGAKVALYPLGCEDSPSLSEAWADFDDAQIEIDAKTEMENEHV